MHTNDDNYPYDTPSLAVNKLQCGVHSSTSTKVYCSVMSPLHLVSYAPINGMPHYPPPMRNQGVPRVFFLQKVDLESGALDFSVHMDISYL